MELNCAELFLSGYFLAYGITNNKAKTQYFPGRRITFMELEYQDYGIYDCHAYMQFENGNRLDLVYARFVIQDDKLKDEVFKPHQLSAFEINFPVLNLPPNDCPNQSSSVYLINDKPLLSIYQGITQGCSFASTLFSYQCKTRYLSFTYIPGTNNYRPKIVLCCNSAVNGRHKLKVKSVAIEFRVFPKDFIMDASEISNHDVSDKLITLIMQYIRGVVNMVFLAKDFLEVIIVMGILVCLIFVYVCQYLMESIINDISDIIMVIFQAIQINIVGKRDDCVCLVLNHDSDNCVVGAEIVDTLEQWTNVCFAERDLAHESNQPLLRLLYISLSNSKKLIVAVSKDFIEDPMSMYFLKSHVVHRITEGNYCQENVVFVILDNAEIPESLLCNFTKSKQWNWNTFVGVISHKCSKLTKIQY